MKGRNFSITHLRMKYEVSDFVTTFIAFLLFNIFRYYELLASRGWYYSPWGYILSEKMILEQIFVPLGLMCIYWLSGYYNSPLYKSRLDEFATTLYSALLSSALIFLLMLINDSTGMKTRDYFVIFVLFALLFMLTYTGRSLLTKDTIRQLKQRKRISLTLIVGNSRKSRQMCQRLKKQGSVWAYDVIGFIRLPHETDVNDSQRVWDLADVESVCREYKVDQIIIAPEDESDNKIIQLLGNLFHLGIPIKIDPDTLSFVTSNIRMNDILGIPFVDITSPRISECQKNIKRSLDVAVSLLTLVLLSPMLLVIAILVKRSSPGPVFYRQERLGKRMKPFTIYKFRSMRDNAEANGPQLSSEEDDRVTPFGKIMRKYRMDELPQFWNVLKGDMSLVGPRPEREFFIRRIIKRAPYYGLIFQVRPGITSWGMVKYGYASTIDQMVARSRFDLIYLNNMSLSTDVKILIYTVRTVLKGAGV